jgi:HlyD family secretion protein
MIKVSVANGTDTTMRKRTLVLLTLLLTAGGGYYFYGVSARQVAAPDIIQAAVSAGDVVETVQVTGTLQPIRTVNVGSQVSGIVAAINADFNSVVRRNDVIARLDPSVFQVQVDLQRAGVERQAGEIRSQEMQLEVETANLARARALFEKGLVTREALDQAELQVKVRTTQVDAARKVLKTAEANLNQAKLNLEHTVIRSPIDGVVVNRLVDVGQAVQSSMNVAQFFTLAADLRRLRLEAVVDEADIGRIRPGMEVEFTVDSYGDETFRGVVETVTLNAATQNNVVTYPVWISVPNDNLKLRPSMTANVLIYVSTARGVTRIPNTATRFRPTTAMFEALGLPAPESRRLARSAGPQEDRPAEPAAPAVAATTAQQIDDLFAPVPRRNVAATVWVWDEEAQTLTERPVRLGITNGQLTELVDGDLTPGQLVVTNIVLPSTGNVTPQQNVFGSMGRGGPGGGRGF